MTEIVGFLGALLLIVCLLGCTALVLVVVYYLLLLAFGLIKDTKRKNSRGKV